MEGYIIQTYNGHKKLYIKREVEMELCTKDLKDSAVWETEEDANSWAEENLKEYEIVKISK